MAPMLDIARKDFERAKSLLKLANVNYSVPSSDNSNDFIYVPSIKFYVAKQRSHLGKDWFECHRELQSNGERMLTFPEFIEFLKYTKDNSLEIYKDITEIRSPWRAEWIDADFKTKGKNLYINSHQDSRLLDKNTLMEDKRISLEDYLEGNHTSQGLPSKKVKSGNLYYWYPRSDNNSVARFCADSDSANLYCWSPSCRLSALGVRAVRHE